MYSLSSTSVMRAPAACLTTTGHGSYAWKLDGTPAGMTFLARSVAVCDRFVRSEYTARSLAVISLARATRSLWVVDTVIGAFCEVVQRSLGDLPVGRLGVVVTPLHAGGVSCEVRLTRRD